MQRAVPIIVEDQQDKLAVVRKGMRVYVGPPAGNGYWLDHTSAPAARASERALREKLRAGWQGTIGQLVATVRRDTAEQARAHEVVRSLERRLATARAEVASLEEQLRRAVALRDRLSR